MPAFAQAWTSNLNSIGPTGLALATVGGDTILYVAEYDGGKVIAYNLTTGATTPTVIAVPGGTFQNPNGILVDASSGDLFVTDRGLNTVTRISNTGTVRWTYGSLGTGPGQFKGPIGIARDSTGAVYITEHDGMRVQKFTVGTTGLVPVVVGWPKDTGFITYSLAIDSSDNVYIGDRSGTVHKYSSAGAALSAGDIPLSGRFATGLFMGASNTLYASQTLGTGSNLVQRFPSGSATANLSFGADGSGDGQFNTAFGVVVNGNLAYIADYENDHVQVWNLTATSGGDTTPPTVAVSASSNTTTSATFTVQFNETVTGATATSFTASAGGGLSGATIASVSPSSTTGTTSYTVVVNFTGTSGTVTLGMAAAANTQIKDASNNFFAGTATGSGSTSATRTVTAAGDTTAPQIASFALTAGDATSGTYHITFDEDVTGVDISDFVLNIGGGATVNGTPTLTAVDARNYDINFTYTSGATGYFQAAIKTSGTGIMDTASNAFAGQGSAATDVQGSGVSFVYPTVSSFTAGTVGASSVNLTLTFSEAVTGVNQADFLASAGATVGTVTGSGTIWTVPVTFSGAGTYTVTVIGGATSNIRNANNYYFGGGTGNSSVQFTATGTGGGSAPTIAASQTAPTGTVGTAFSYQVVATGATSYSSASTFPAGLSLNTTTGVISGTPTAATSGSGMTVAVTATNTNGSNTGNVVLKIDAASSGSAPTIAASQTAPTGTVGTAFSYQVVATGATSYSSASTFPAGLSLNTTTGVISGTPTAATSGSGMTVAVTATNTNGSNTGNVVLKIDAASSGSAPTIAASQTAPTGTVGTAFSYQVVATGATSYSSASTFPAGLSLNTTTGVISGTPTAATSGSGMTVAVTATNTNGSNTGNVVLKINPASSGSAPTIAASQTAPTGTVGTAFSYQVVATGATSYSSASTFPAGLSLNTTTGVISGTPTAATSGSGMTVAVTATNTNGSNTGNVVLHISSGPAIPVVTTAVVNGTIGTPITPVTVQATNNPTSFEAPVLGAYGLTINNSGVISGTPSSAGAGIAVVVKATNSAGVGQGTITLNLSYPTTTPPVVTPPVITPPVITPPVVTKQNQTIVFTTPTSSVLVNTPINLGATTSSGLPITYAIVTGNATLDGSTLTIKDTGTVVVRASQSGNDSYNAAEPVNVTFNATKASQSIVFAALSGVPSTMGSIDLSATATSGLPVSFTVVSGPATLNGSTLTLNGASGTVVVRASQGGNETFDAATSVTRSFVITPVGSQVFFGKLGDDDFAASIDKAGSKGMFIARLAQSGQAIVLKFKVAADGSFTATTKPISVTDQASSPIVFSLDPQTAAAANNLTITGTLSNGILAGRIVETNTPFSANVQAGTGATASLAGLYSANIPGSSSGDAYIVVGPTGQAYALAITPTGVFSGTGTVSSAGAVDVTLAPNTTITADLTSDGRMSGHVTAAGVARALAGLGDGAERTDRLINLSSRLRVTGGDASRAVIAGFVVSGTSNKQILVRAVGPGLNGFGITDALSAPTLQIFDSKGTVIAANSGWANNTDISLVGDRVGAFKLNNGSKDAAVVIDLAPGAYTAQVTSAAGNGVVLLEVYDAATGTQLSTQQLVNISTRGYVDTGVGELVAGFVVTGNAPKRVLIRGIGPGLTAFGVPGAVVNPMLKVYQAGVSAAIAQNDDWETGQPIDATQVAATAADISAASSAVGAFPLLAGSKDAAIVITLMPGNYSAVVSGANGGTGAGLVEVYEIPAP